MFEVASGKKTLLKGAGHALAWTAEGTLLRAMNDHVYSERP